MKKKLLLGICITLLALRIDAQNMHGFKIPAMPNPAARKATLEREWAPMQTMPPQLGVRDWVLFLVDALDTRFLKDEQVEWLLKKAQIRMITNPAADRSYGNIFWGWNEAGFDVGDGINVQFVCNRLSFRNSKEVASINCTRKATPLLTESNQVLIATTNYGKGYVLAIGDPWSYN